jgi:hypothetical protein
VRELAPVCARAALQRTMLQVGGGTIAAILAAALGVIAAHG